MLTCECSFLFSLLTAKDVSPQRIVSCGKERRETGIFAGCVGKWGVWKRQDKTPNKNELSKPSKKVYKKIQVLQDFTGENEKKNWRFETRKKCEFNGISSNLKIKFRPAVHAEGWITQPWPRHLISRSQLRVQSISFDFPQLVKVTYY